MFESSRILELFEKQKDIVNERITDGIERYRKGNATVTIVGKDGKAMPNAKLKITQKSHEFRFGANLFMLDELETPEKNETYKKRFADVFNMATLPFYWSTLEPEKGNPRYAKDSSKVYRRPAPDLCIEFCEKNSIEPREHALAYDHFFPEWLYGTDVEEVKYHMERHFSEISERYADKIPTIEVTNEMEWPKGNTKFYDAHDYVEWCFKTAEKYFRNNKLCINESTALCWEDTCRTTDKYYAYIEANMLKGARIDAIGMQYHLFFKQEEAYVRTRRLLNPISLYNHMDMYASLGKPLQVTEVTIPSYSWNVKDEELQAEILEWLYSVWFSHPNVEQIIYWNLADGYAHVENADPTKIRESQGNMSLGENYYHGGLLRFDLSCKPAYERLKELVQRRWHTEFTAVADEKGNVDFRGFYGSYELEVNGEVREFNLSSKSENTETIVI